VFLSSLSGALLQGINLAGRITYLGNYTYDVQIFNADSKQMIDQAVTFDGTLTSDDPGTLVEGEFWTVLFQRAYLAMMSNLNKSYTDPNYAMSAISGRAVQTFEPGSDDAPSAQAALAAGFLITAGDANETTSTYAHHSYTVMKVYQNNGVWFI